MHAHGDGRDAVAQKEAQAEASVPGDSSLPPWSGRVLGSLASLWSSSSLEELKLSLTWKQAADAWVQVRANVMAPVLQVAVALCMLMSVMLVSEKLLMGATSLFAKVFRWRPQRRYKYQPLGEDMEVGYPMVLVQIPMYNEKQVYKLSIGAACGLSWPLDRIIIQVLDDSTDPEIKNLVELECKTWKSKGFNIKYEIRDNRHGYKAGALKEGMKHSYVGHCDFVAIFDADFQPEELLVFGEYQLLRKQENVMSMNRMRAVWTGLFETGKVNEWVVTKKLGSKLNEQKTEEPRKQTRSSIFGRILLPELGMALYLFLCACYDLRYGKNNYFFYIYPQAITFFIVGIGYVGTLVPS
ncbi:Glucomannan 4-beta-mannosyltransferase [Musa troglodytarum]|uniref:Glucomannan 4-beta-mannosyltransferase n=1 Tax=Musa troglodytarum TaxID=320322 RepID=A0A9E7KJN8_9LILI|nr:Glucomannan 4-beta-mannosyltransferase [Musa troglodytarum]